MMKKHFICISAFLSLVVSVTVAFADSGDNFVLLYSTLGYELNGTKRALVRTIDAIDEKTIDAAESKWLLINSKGTEKASGVLKWLGMTYGAQLWEIDFSHCQTPGKYRLRVNLKGKSGKEICGLESLEFEIAENLYTKRLFYGLTVNNAESREAKESEGFGYYDCTSSMGERDSHAAFMEGLIQSYIRRQHIMSPTDKTRLIRAVNICFDYLILLHDSIKGNVNNQYPTRHNEYIHLGNYANISVIEGLLSYLGLFSHIDPIRAKEAYKRVFVIRRYIDNKMPLWFTSRKKIMYNYYLYKYAGNPAFKEASIAALNDYLLNFKKKNLYSGGWRFRPRFEGLYHLAKEFKDDPNRPFWIEKAKEISIKHLPYILKNNHFHVLPQGNQKNWDDMSRVPAVSGWGGFYANTHFAASTIDAVYLAEITGDRSLEKIAAGSMGWLTGLHVGLPAHGVLNPPTSKPIASAAFIMNLDARCARAWTNWRWWGPPDKKAMSVMNGFVVKNGKWAYPDEWPSAEIFIHHDGAFLYAMVVYENYLNKVKKQ